ncbi:MAG: RNA polymerase sigma-70 factor [Bacteroidales bacterium]
MAELEQEGLLRDLKGGKDAALKRVFYVYYRDLVMYAYSIIGDMHAAEDLVQEFFINFWANKRYKDIHTSLENYLFLSVRNATLNVLRKEKCKIKKLEEFKYFQEQSVDPNMEESGYDYSKIYKAIQKLPYARRNIFMMCCFGNMKYQEVADKLNISINTVKVQMGRAFKFIRENSFLTVIL